MPKSTNHDWAAIEKLAITGVPYPVICETHGVNGNTLRVRAHRGKWPVPHRIEKAGRMALAANGNATHETTVKQRGVSGEIATQQAAAILAERGELGSLRASELLLALLERANVERLKPLATVSDVSTALSAVRKAAGMDRTEGVNCNVNLAMFGSGEVEWVPSAEGVADGV